MRASPALTRRPMSPFAPVALALLALSLSACTTRSVVHLHIEGTVSADIRRLDVILTPAPPDDPGPQTLFPPDMTCCIYLPTDSYIELVGFDGDQLTVDITAVGDDGAVAFGSGTENIDLGEENELTITLEELNGCGDGILDPGEECDTKDFGTTDCASLGYGPGNLDCTDSCVIDFSDCGFCGNDRVDPTEDCDGTDPGADDCVDLGYTGGTIACGPGCAYDTTGCTGGGVCGDGTVGGGEDCDGSNLNGQNCNMVDPIFDGGMLSCMSDCSFDTSMCFGCGDGTINGGEQCEAGNLNGQDCTTIGMGFVGGALACDTTICQFVTVACTPPPSCGNMMLDGTEDCDNSFVANPLNGQDCAGATSGASPFGTLACTSGCVFDTTACHACGNGVLDPPEECDGGDFGSASCMSSGFDGGTLVCDPSCLLNTAGCLNAPTVPALRKPMNNAYVGSPFVVPSLAVTFVWEPSTVMPAGSIAYEIEISDNDTFMGATPNNTTATTHTTGPLQINVPPGVTPAGRRYYWHVRACVGVVCSTWSPTWWVNVGRDRKDFDGDGYADVAVGERLFDPIPAVADAGHASVFFGASGGVATSAGWEVDGEAAGDNFGYDVNAAGDFNGDGFADLLVTARFFGSGTDLGKAYLFLGGSSFSLSPAATFVSGVSGQVARATGVGDVNCDGFDDVVIGNGEAAAGNGEFHVVFGSSSVPATLTPATSVTGTAGEKLGNALAGGDLNGDGCSDVIVGGPTNGTGGADSGRVHVYFGGLGTALETTEDGTLFEVGGDTHFGEPLSTGDIDGDGFADVLAGARLSDTYGMDAGEAFLYRGGPGSIFDSSYDAALFDGSAQIGAEYGTVAFVGDVDGDGFDDFVISARKRDNAGDVDIGVAYVHTGGAVPGDWFGLNATIVGLDPGEEFGVPAAIGDVSGDGFADFAIAGPCPLGACGAWGLVRIYHGGTLFDGVHEDQLNGLEADGLFGWGLAALFPADPLLSSIGMCL